MENLKFLSYVQKFFTGGYFAYALVAAAGFWVLNMYRQNQDLKVDLLKKEQNYAALHDSLRTEKTKNGELQASQTILLLSEKELKSVNRELYDEVRLQKGKVISLTKSVISLKQDTIILRKYIKELESEMGEMVKVNDSTYSAPWTLTYRYDANNFDILKGRTKIGVQFPNQEGFNLSHIGTELLEKETRIQLMWGTRIEDGKIRVFVQSPYPGFTPESLQGVILDPNDNKMIRDLIKKKRWFTGFNFGLGVTSGYQIGGGWGTVFGPSLNWSIYQW